MGENTQLDFNKVIPRQGTGSRKWDALQSVFGNSSALPLWIADMDFASPSVVNEHSDQARTTSGVRL